MELARRMSIAALVLGSSGDGDVECDPQIKITAETGRTQPLSRSQPSCHYCRMILDSQDLPTYSSQRYIRSVPDG